MTLSTSDLVKARETANSILEELRLDAFLFEVEPKNETWELNIECACESDGAWETFTLQVPRQMLLDGFDDNKVKQRLFEYWKKKLAACKIQQA